MVAVDTAALVKTTPPARGSRMLRLLGPDPVHTRHVRDVDGYRRWSMVSATPPVWCHEYGGGRSLCTALGHSSQAYTDPVFRQHLPGGLDHAAGR